MNMNNKSQINRLIKHLFYHYTVDIEENNDNLNDFNYIKTNKKRIKFFIRKFYKIVIDIPSYITKLELYSIAQKYASNRSKILLIHENKILNKDESNINELSNDDVIVIIENKIYPDNSFINELQKKYPGSPKINIWVDFTTGLKKTYPVNGEVTIQKLLKAISEENGLDNIDCQFLFNGEKLKRDDIRKIKEFNISPLIITCMMIVPIIRQHIGKILEGEAVKSNRKIAVEAGTLDDIDFFIL